MCLGGIQNSSQAVQTSTSQGHAGDHFSPNGVVVVTDPGHTTGAIREPTVDEVRKEWQGRVANLQDQLKGMADLRVQRLREIAIDTAIRNSDYAAAKIGGGRDEGQIVKAAAVFYAFLDTGAVPA